MQVLATAAMVGLVAHFLSGQPGPAASFVGNGLALSSTAVVLQQRYLRDGRYPYPPLLYSGREIEGRFCEYVDAINKIEGSGSPGLWSATVDVKQVMKIGSVISQGPPPFKKAVEGQTGHFVSGAATPITKLAAVSSSSSTMVVSWGSMCPGDASHC
ncbi:hypothetical protein Nepgr_028366 [Nepenthes gracilis]|uniref:Uncharacterized protein n=1 Tax=Nepenthes gracilis TaxID=150966 RepID=A0AAD3TAJ1_NEPGR|nr:hypothetical protein Nepgr_028366 [Nepenthes gracilis]